MYDKFRHVALTQRQPITALRPPARTGYSVSSTAIFPAIAITGRLSTDSLGIMTQGETIVQPGGGAQTGASRWGDYSTMNIDPTDGEHMRSLRLNIRAPILHRFNRLNY